MNPRQLAVPIALLVMGVFGSVDALAKYAPQMFLAMGVIGAAAVVHAQMRAPKGAGLAPLIEALRVVARGKRPTLPENVVGDLAEVFDLVDQIAKRGAELAADVARLEQRGPAVDVATLVQAAARVKKGDRLRIPPGTSEEVVALYDELSALGETLVAHAADEKRWKDEAATLSERASLAEQDAKTRRAEVASVSERLATSEQDNRAARSELAALTERLAAAEHDAKARRADVVRDFGDLADAAVRAGEGERLRVPPSATAEAARVFAEISVLAERVSDAEQREKARTTELALAAGAIEDAFPRLSEGVSSVLTASEQATGHIREMTTALANIAQSIESLATSAEESSSSILEMTATNDETAENVGELASSVRETVSSIEEMAYSIREVAKNVDALSLTAEETSSSMNEMDVSIDQVQSNANETARLSEEVASDAEKGAEAILKTIGEIYRIKESSQEAVAVISNLGFRIEAIGQILAVIDDVAEQTNLLALNAAIIAAQAGEHGKGFAVVADEIKDLAERAGGSTKEIAELIKTIQAESKNAIAAVERGAHNVDRGVEVSNEAERALKKILESSQKSTNMVRAIARATVEQAKGSKQVTDAIGRIAETVQQIAAATAEQARGSELIMKSAEKMRTITQHVERSSQEQARGGRQITTAIEQISNMVNSLNGAQRTQMRGGEQLIEAARRIDESVRSQEQAVRQLVGATERLRKAVNG
jgi:methyl-accepting chemotaxis protein